MIKKTAKRAKARLNKHTAPTIKKYVSKAERAEQQAKLEAEELAKQNEIAKDVESEQADADSAPAN